MTLNRISTEDIQKIDNEYPTSKITRLPLIALQKNIKFHLVQPKNGKLITKPVYSGFTKNNLSSIPKDTEIILLNKENKEELLYHPYEKYNLPYKFQSNEFFYNNGIAKEINNRNISRVSSYTSDNINNKTIVPFSTCTSNSLSANHKIINEKSKNDTKIDATKNDSILEKLKKTDTHPFLKNKRIKNLSYNDYKQFFSPGPSDYYSEKSFDYVDNKCENRYKNLYQINSHTQKDNKIIKSNSPGPGSYIKSDISFVTKNSRKINIKLDRREKRFKINKDDYSLGPGQYFSDNNSNKNLLQKINKKKSDEMNQEIFDMNNNNQLQENSSDKGEKNDFNNVAKNINNNIKEFKHFNNLKFERKIKFNRLLNKYITTNEEQKYEVPGPGKYDSDLFFGFSRILNQSQNEDYLYKNNKKENLIPEEVLKEFSMKKNDIWKKNKSNCTRSCENIFESNRPKENGTFPFISKIKRIEFQDKLLSKHTPGPCYYYNDSSQRFAKKWKKVNKNNISKISN